MAHPPFGSDFGFNSWELPPPWNVPNPRRFDVTVTPPPVLLPPSPAAMSRPVSTASSVPGFTPCIVSGTLPRDGWGPSRSPSRMRDRLSSSLLSPVPLHPHPNDSAPMQRPAYLDHSALRRHIVVDPRPTETTILEPVTRSSSVSLSIVSDSDEDPREARGTPTPEPRPEPSSAIRVPTRWNAADKHHALVLSPDGREVRYPSEYGCVIVSTFC